MNRKLLLLLTGLIFIPLTMAAASEVKPDDAGWQLINKDSQGNMLYVNPASGEQSGSGTRLVWMKVETPAENSPSPMLFLNEVDCSQGLIKRLEVKLYSSASGSGEPFQTMSFDGKWDKPSKGNEEILQESICGQNLSDKM